MQSRNNTMRMTGPGHARFMAMAATYCLGVFNDNFFKQAAMLVAVLAGLNSLQGRATVLFALPFILFSSYAGWFADRFAKRTVIIGAKGLELAAMLIGAAGMVTGNWLCILSMVFLMGLQSAFFGPALNGSIPELYPEERVLRINAMLKAMTTLAILAGIAAAGVCLDRQGIATEYIPSGRVLVAVVVLLMAGSGFLASFGVHGRPAAAPQKPFPWLGPINSLYDLKDIGRDHQLLLAILAESYFYGIASIAVLTINVLALQQLHFSSTIASMLSMCLMIGICVGSLPAARLTLKSGWFNPVITAGFGMGSGLLLGSLTPLLPVAAQPGWLAFSLLVTGICGGLFLIPVTSFLQVRPAGSEKGRVLATSGFCCFVGIMLSGFLFSVLDSMLSPSTIMASLAAFALLTSGLFHFARLQNSVGFRVLLQTIMRLVLEVRYSIEVKGLDAVRGKGSRPIIFLPNHPALIDPALCMALLYAKFRPRPLVDLEQSRKPLVSLLLRVVRPILLPDLHKNGRNSRTAIKEALAEVVDSLRQGENILFYPSGHLTRAAEEDLAGNSGVEYVLKQIPDIQVVLVRTTGLWGSSFSFARGSTPSLFKHLKKYLVALLANGLFFGPRRKVTIEFVADEQLPKIAGRQAINHYLESFYNLRKQTNTRVPYFWWQGSKPVMLPEPLRNTIHGNAVMVPTAIRQQVIDKIRSLTGLDDIKSSDRLANDLAVDSLSLMELAVWLETEFGMPVDDMTALITVDDCILAAGGRKGDSGTAELRSVARKWFKGDDGEELVFPGGDTIASVFMEQARMHPRRVILADQLSGMKTYRDLITAVFVLKPMVEKIQAERIGIMLPASVSAAAAFLAVMFSGKTPVLLNWTVGIGNMKHGASETKLTHIISAKALYSRLQGQGAHLADLQADWLFVDEIAARLPWHKKLGALLQAYCRPRSLQKVKVAATAAILFTSGSESKPKAVPLSHANILANMLDFTSLMRLTADNRLLGMLPPFHSLGLVGTLILPLCLGLKTVYHPNPTESATLAKIVEQYRVSLMIGTPTFLGGIINSATREQLASLRLLFTGAEKCPDHVYQAVEQRCPQAVLCEGYGITECSPLVSVNRIEEPKSGTIGRVLPSMEYAVIDDATGKRVPRGTRGVLLVRGPNIFGGYLNKADDAGFYQFEGRKWYETGDFVSEDEHGVLTFCGRKKRFIKLGGEMISLPAIESVLLKQFANSDEGGGPSLAVAATADDEHPEIVLFSTSPIDREEANHLIRTAGLSGLHNIRRLQPVEEIPVLGTGKTDYRQLQESLAA